MAGQFNPYAAGRKMYGAGRDFPTIGPVDKMGYKERDAQASARKRAVMRRLKSMYTEPKKVIQPDGLRSLG
jgi:hypothetical protein